MLLAADRSLDGIKFQLPFSPSFCSSYHLFIPITLLSAFLLLNTIAFSPLLVRIHRFVPSKNGSDPKKK